MGWCGADDDLSPQLGAIQLAPAPTAGGNAAAATKPKGTGHPSRDGDRNSGPADQLQNLHTVRLAAAASSGAASCAATGPSRIPQDVSGSIECSAEHLRGEYLHKPSRSRGFEE